MSFKIITTEELIKLLNKFDHKELHAHHTWLPDHSHFNGSNGLEIQQNMRNYHVNVRKWSDIAQHVTLLPNGLWVTGRDFGRTPASISGYNTGAFCVEMLGNFDKGHDKFEGKQKDSMLALSKYFYDKKRYIRFHNENASKSCPGTSIDKGVFMNEVKNYGVKKTIISANVVYEGKQVKGFIEDGQTFVQIRDLANLMGVQIGYDYKTRTTTFNNQVVNGKVVDGRTYLHVRVAAKVVGLNVGWDQDTRTVKLYK